MSLGLGGVLDPRSRWSSRRAVALLRREDVKTRARAGSVATGTLARSLATGSGPTDRDSRLVRRPDHPSTAKRFRCADLLSGWSSWTPSLTAMAGVLRPGMTVIDVGSHRRVSMRWSRRRSFSLEVMSTPSSRSRRVTILSSAAPKEEAGWRTTSRCCRSLSPTSMDLFSFGVDDRSMGGWIRRAGESHVIRSHSIGSRWSVGISHVGFVKIDAGGHEVAVFRGSADLLRDESPTLICKLYSPAVTRDRFDSRFAGGCLGTSWLGTTSCVL